MPDKIIDSVLIKNIVKNGKVLGLKYATQTDAWNRLALGRNVKYPIVLAKPLTRPMCLPTRLPQSYFTLQYATKKINQYWRRLSETQHPNQNDPCDREEAHKPKGEHL